MPQRQQQTRFKENDMSDNATIRRTVKGTIFSVESVKLPPREEGQAERTMGVIWIDGENGVERYTDFSSIHKVLVEDRPVRAVFEESTRMEGGFPKTHRNLVAATQD